MTISGFDHVAIPIENVKEMLSFYGKLGFTVNDSIPAVYSVHFGDNKINFHDPELWQSKSFGLRGPTAQPGCGDFCFVWNGSEASLIEHLNKLSVKIIEGPVKRTGGHNHGRDTGTSVYIRDPDKNLLEFIVYH